MDAGVLDDQRAGNPLKVAGVADAGLDHRAFVPVETGEIE